MLIGCLILASIYLTGWLVTVIITLRKIGYVDKVGLIVSAWVGLRWPYYAVDWLFRRKPQGD